MRGGHPGCGRSTGPGLGPGRIHVCRGFLGGLARGGSPQGNRSAVACLLKKFRIEGWPAGLMRLGPPGCDRSISPCLGPLVFFFCLLHGSYGQQAWCEGVSLVGIEAPGRAEGRRMSGMMLCQVFGPTRRWGLRRGEIEALVAVEREDLHRWPEGVPLVGIKGLWDFPGCYIFLFGFFSSGKWNSASLLLVARIHPWR